jgi:hypothetical protein
MGHIEGQMGADMAMGQWGRFINGAHMSPLNSLRVELIGKGRGRASYGSITILTNHHHNPHHNPHPGAGARLDGA